MSTHENIPHEHAGYMWVAKAASSRLITCHDEFPPWLSLWHVARTREAHWMYWTASVRH